MGVPGKVVREVDAKNAERIRLGAISYQNLMRRYRDGMKEV